MNTIENFDKFWDKAVEKSADLEIDEPRLPRQIKKPARFRNENDNVSQFPTCPKEHYQKIYKKAFDNTINCLNERFNQKGFDKYAQLQNVLSLAAKKLNYDQDLTEILNFYGDDFDENRLKSQLKIFSAMFPEKSEVVFEDIINFFKNLEAGFKPMLSEVAKLLELVLVLPATTATAERSFSKLKLVKTHLRSTMKQTRLNHFMLLGLNQELLDKLDTNKIAQEFVSQCYDNTREKLFGKPQ